MSTTEEKKEPKPFGEWLEEQSNGATQVDLSKQLNELVTAVVLTGKKGELTLKVKVKPNGDNMVIVEDEVKVTLPEPTRPNNIYFVDDHGNPQRENPRQTAMNLREVPNKVRDIS